MSAEQEGGAAAERQQGAAAPEAAVPVPPAVSLWSLFFTFLRIGSTAWGGFMALISVVQNVLVERRRLLSHEEMLDGISLATLLPGPIAVNVIAYAGYRLRGTAGAVVSMVGVILPAFLFMIALSYVYFTWGEVPAVGKVFAAFLPAMCAIVVSTAWGLGRKTIKAVDELLLAAAAAALLLGVGGFYVTLGIIAAAGLYGVARHRAAQPAAPATAVRGWGPALAVKLLLLALVVALFLVPLPGVGRDSPAQLLITFSGMSLLLFGGGFVFIPLIQEIVVDGFHWVTQQEFATGVAIGQVTPGPILLSAAFVGYKVQGLWGALLATIGIFGPSALLMLTATQMMERIKSSRPMQAALRGIRPAVIGMIAAAAVVIAQTVPVHWLSGAIFAAGLVALLRYKVDAVWIIPIAGLLGILFY